jgi:hypothetical protein
MSEHRAGVLCTETLIAWIGAQAWVILASMRRSRRVHYFGS